MKTDIGNNSSGFRRYFTNISWLMGHRVLSMIVAFFVGIYVTRYLGPLRFGLLSYAASFVGLFTALANLGLDSIVVRDLVKTPAHRDELLGTAFWLKLGGAVVMWIGIVTAIPFTHNDTLTNILIFIIASGVIFQAFNVIDLNFQAEVKSKYVVWAQIIQLAVSSTIKLCFIWISASLVWFACIFLLDAVVYAIGLAVVYSKNNGKIWYWRWRWETAKVLLKDSWPLILSGVAVSIYMKIDQVMIKEMLGAEQVGFYAAAAKLSEAWYFIPVAITSSLFPAIINAEKKSEDLYYHRLQKLYDLMIWISVPIALLTTFLASWIIRVLYGNAFLPSAGVLIIHIWAGVFVCLGLASGKWFLIEGLQKYAFYRTLLGAVVNVGLNLLMIPKYGTLGAAYATVIAYAVAGMFSDLLQKETRPMFKMKLRSFNILRTSISLWRKEQ